MNASTRFLLVDNFSATRRIVRKLLREIGYDKVDEAEDGAVALSKLKCADFDVVVSELNLPYMSGLELVRHIRADARLKGLPVLLVTGDAGREDIEGAARAGASDWIVKPFSRAALARKLAGIALPRAEAAL